MTEERKAESIYNIEYILSQIAKIQEQTEYLNDALEKLSQMGDGESGAPGSPGNIQGQAKAQAFADIVRCRETTNQKMLSLYEKMYDDLKPDNGNKKLDVLEKLAQIAANTDDFSEKIRFAYYHSANMQRKLQKLTLSPCFALEARGFT